MIITFTKKFVKNFKQLSQENRGKIEQAIEQFREDPFTETLRNHKLQGSLRGMRSISAGYDLRLLYSEENGHTIIHFVRVGTHDQMYR